MIANLTDLIPSFSGLKIIVIGEAMLDCYLAGPSDRLSREAPVPIVDVAQRLDVPGGGANTAINVHSLGAQVMFLSVIGNDLEGILLRRALEERGVSTEYLLTQPRRQTLAKHRVMVESHLLVRFDQGDKQPVDPGIEQVLIERLIQLFPQCDAVIISDYDYGILTPNVIAALTQLQAQTPQPIVVDSKKLPAYRSLGVTAVKPNFNEALRLVNVTSPTTEYSRVDLINQYSHALLEATGAQIVAVTLDVDGALFFEHDRPPYRTYAQPVAHSRAAGAGDTLLSALALALAVGATTPAAAEIASAAATVVVAKEGTATCTATELHERILGGNKCITDPQHLVTQLENYRQQGRRLVFTNGCFDLLHRGHIDYLNNAKALGDVLIVGLNSDASVRRLKGEPRPISSLEDRIQVLSALSCVDHIVVFEEDTPANLIQLVRPDIYVKGGDYTRATLPEAALVESLGGRVEILPYLHDHSTTSIIERIRRAYAWNTLDLKKSTAPERASSRSASVTLPTRLGGSAMADSNTNEVTHEA